MPSPWVELTSTSITGRSPEMSKRQSSRRSHTSRAALWGRTARACGRVRLMTSALVRVCMAVKFSALIRKARRRMLVSVADISEARLTLLVWRYLSITARRVSTCTEAAVAKVKRALACGAMSSLTDSAHTGSSPVSSAVSTSPDRIGAGPRRASGWLGPRLRPCQLFRSVVRLTWMKGVLMSVRKWAILSPCSASRRGLRESNRA